MTVVTSPSREISSSEPLKEEPWTSCQEVTVSNPSSLERASWFSSNGVVLFRHFPGDREFQTRLRTRGKAVLQGIHHLLGENGGGPCLERRGLALPGSSHLIRIVTRSNNEFVRGCCSILSCHRDNKF